MPKSRLALLMVLGAVFAPISSATAAQRYASPNGAGICAAADPCAIKQAVEGAGPGDEVIVNPGDYPLSGPIHAAKPVTIHGLAGQPRPRLLFTAGGLQLDNAAAL